MVDIKIVGKNKLNYLNPTKKKWAFINIGPIV